MIKLFGNMKSEMKEGKVDYSVLRLTGRQWFLWGMLGMVGAVCMVMIFYRSFVMMAIAGVLGTIILPRVRKEYLIQKRQQQLSMEFKDALYSLVVSLRAGRSVEGAFEASLEDLDPVMTPLIYREWYELVKQLGVGFTVEDGMEDLGRRSGIEEIQSFGRMVSICKRSEGDVARVMENTIQLLQERLEIQTELKILLAKKKTEQKILNIMPFVVIGLLLMMSPEYLEPLYDCLKGQIIMTVCIALTIASYLLSKKISDITL